MSSSHQANATCLNQAMSVVSLCFSLVKKTTLREFTTQFWPKNGSQIFLNNDLFYECKYTSK